MKLKDNKLIITGVLPVKKILDKIKGSSYDKLSDELTVPYTFPVTRYLSWLGIDLDGFEWGMTSYKPPLVEGQYPLMDHQVVSLAKMTTWGYCFNLSLPRTGKTPASIAGIDLLQKEKQITSALIVTPLSTIYSVWVKEIRGMLPDASIGVLHSTKHTNKAKADYFKSLLDEKFDFYIINPAGIKNQYAIDIFINARENEGHFRCINVDESTEFGNQTTKNWKALNKVKMGVPYLWLLTGTPGDPMTVHGQIRLLKPDSVPKNKSAWRMQTMYSPREHIWLPKPNATEVIRKLLSPAVRYTREQVLPNFPRERILPIEIPLGEKAKFLYNKLIDDALVEVEKDNEIIEITASNAGVLTNKLIQIASGMLKTEEDYLVFEDTLSSKIEEVKRLISEAEGKVIIVTGFTAVNKAIVERLGDDAIGVTGNTSAVKRGEIFGDFMQNPKGKQVLVAHPTVIKFGVELASASDLVFWSVPFIAPLAYKQVKDRIYSGKQQCKFPTVYQMSSTALERKMYSNLENKLEWQTDLADFFIKE